MLVALVAATGNVVILAPMRLQAAAFGNERKQAG